MKKNWNVVKDNARKDTGNNHASLQLGSSKTVVNSRDYLQRCEWGFIEETSSSQ